MKVLQINSVCGIKSTGRICVGIARVLMEKGHQCKIAFGRDYVPPKYEDIAIRIGSPLGVKIAALKSRFFDNEGLNCRAATKRLIKDIKAFAPDIIHLHNIHGYYVNYEELFRYIKEAEIPVVVTLHDCWFFTGHCPHFDFIGCDKWKAECGNCPEKKNYPKSILLDRSKKNLRDKKAAFSGSRATVVGVSEWLSGLAVESFLKQFEIRTIHNGVDLEKFRPTDGNFRERYGLEDKKIILGVASTWTDSKGLQDYIKLAAVLKEDECIVLVGTDEEVRKQLPESIIAVDRTDSIEQLCEIYTAADVFLNFTLNESFSLVNLEALACGTPVVTYPTGGTAEMLDEKCGLVAKEQSFEAAYSLIGKAMTFKSEDCIARSKDFSMKDKFAEYVDLYEEILSK